MPPFFMGLCMPDTEEVNKKTGTQNSPQGTPAAEKEFYVPAIIRSNQLCVYDIKLLG
jgi:hypothetical protein